MTDTGRAKAHNHIAWIGAIRGFAALSIYIYHFILPLPLDSRVRENPDPVPLERTWMEASLSTLLQAIFTGRPWLAFFFLISGYVLSHHPLQLTRQGRTMEAYAATSSSLFRRGLRLYLPTLVAAFASLVIVASGILDLYGYPKSDLTPWQRLLDWCHWCFFYLGNLWFQVPTELESNYGGHFWTVPTIYRGSLIVFVLLLAVIRVKFRVGFMILTGALAYSAIWGWWRPITACFVTGSLLAMIHMWNEKPRRIELIATESPEERITGERGRVSVIIARYAALAVGVYLTFKAGGHISAFNLPEVPRDDDPWLIRIVTGLTFIDWCVGPGLVIASLHFLPHIRNWLASIKSLQYLGEISFSLYLVHLPFLLLVGSPLASKIAQLTSHAHWGLQAAAIMCIWTITTPILLLIAHAFLRYVEIPSGRFAKYMEGVCMREDANSESALESSMANRNCRHEDISRLAGLAIQSTCQICHHAGTANAQGGMLDRIAIWFETLVSTYTSHSISFAMRAHQDHGVQL